MSKTQSKFIVIPPKKGVQHALNAKPIVIAPLNTDLNPVLPKVSAPKLKALRAAAQTLPDTWDWKDVYPNDNDKIKDIKSKILKPRNQLLCGSCWAVSTTSAISDVFLISGLINENPDLSSTYALSTYVEGQCEGGNPSALLDNIQENGIASSHCVDYSWCDTNTYCNGGSKNDFGDGFSKYLNTIIPASGCYAGNHLLYYVKECNSLYLDKDEKNLQDMIMAIKQHIYSIGPVVAGYRVYEEFMYDFYRDGADTDWVYIEKSTKNPAGSHAVVVMGWAIKNNIPCWLVRNSWGESFGKDGYFYMPMYPYNKTSQFEKLVYDDSGRVAGGGFSLFSADKIADGNIPSIGFPSDLNQPKDYYKTEVGKPDALPDSGNTDTTSKKNKLNIILISVGTGIGLIILILIIVLALK